MSLKILEKKEKKVMTYILKKYRNMPCLWNPSHEAYSNKNVRKKHYNELLRRYRIYAPGATVIDLKKRIMNMRTTYRRERAKVLKGRESGIVYYPTLWYYDLLKFLDEDDSGDVMEHEIEYLDEDEEQIIIQVQENDSLDNVKSKSPDILTQKRIEIENEEDYKLEDDSYLNDDESSQGTTSSGVFGKAIGMQLNELTPLQKFIAEKLISDVLFYARLEKLQTSTQIQNVLSDDDDDE